ncbi:MAG TPA: hypothetical protein VHG69_07095 [Thermoleophilaceae bacterium]|nr:hypothetical protein [Thermoleophilaceae bacterium]
MRRRTRTAIACTCAAALAASFGWAPASMASSGQLTVMQDDGLVVHSGDEARERTLDEFDALGADIVKVQVYWREIAPGGSRKPNFDATNPDAYSWGAYDAAVRGIVARGMRPFLVLGNRAPSWARARRTHHDGTYRPDASEFELFSRAAGTRYSGSHGGLPRVELWSIWNEPNLSSWLAPQRSRGGTPLSPSIYRRLYLAGWRGLRDSGHSGDTILLGELMPLGARGRGKVPPLEFLREMACLDSRYRPFRGRAARVRGCGSVGRIPTSGIAYHPYTPRGGPRARPRANEASIGSLGRITRVADAIARRGRLSSRVPVWITEYGFQTDPPDPFQYPIGRVPGFMDVSEWLAFRNRRVASYSQYTLRDDRPNPGSIFRRYAGFQMGLRFASGRPKPGVYAAFRMPFFVRLLSRNRVEVFGGLRTAGGGSASIASRRGRGSYRPLGQPGLNSSGYFRAVLRAPGAARRTYRLQIGDFTRTKRAAR